MLFWARSGGRTANRPWPQALRVLWAAKVKVHVEIGAFTVPGCDHHCTYLVYISLRCTFTRNGGGNAPMLNCIGHIRGGRACTREQQAFAQERVPPNTHELCGVAWCLQPCATVLRASTVSLSDLRTGCTFLGTRSRPFSSTGLARNQVFRL